MRFLTRGEKLQADAGKSKKLACTGSMMYPGFGPSCMGGRLVVS